MSKIVKMNEICEARINNDWCIGEVVDITPNGKTYWVETWEDTYEVEFKDIRKYEE